jgi:hypothetical protein
MRTANNYGAILVLIALSGCSPGDANQDAAAADSLTRAQRDSAIGASSLPGAGGVRGAIEIADSARARQATADSIGS